MLLNRPNWEYSSTATLLWVDIQCDIFHHKYYTWVAVKIKQFSSRFCAIACADPTLPVPIKFRWEKNNKQKRKKTSAALLSELTFPIINFSQARKISLSIHHISTNQPLSQSVFGIFFLLVYIYIACFCLCSFFPFGISAGFCFHHNSWLLGSWVWKFLISVSEVSAFSSWGLLILVLFWIWMQCYWLMHDSLEWCYETVGIWKNPEINYWNWDCW